MSEAAKEIQRCVRQIHRRQCLQSMWRLGSLGLLVGGLVACGLAIARIAGGADISIFGVLASLVAGPVCGAVLGLLRAPTIRDAAVAIDGSYGLKDRTQTALEFLSANHDQPLRVMQINDARQHLTKVDPVGVVPATRPRSLPWACIAGVSALVLFFVYSPKRELIAAPTPSAAVATSIERAANGLDELREFQQQQPDPELEKLLQELAEQFEQLQEPGLDPKEALAELSEMESALREMQQKLTDPGLEADLEKVGEALSLSEAMAKAGSAMAKGDMEKASEELTKLDLPKLDSKTEKAITQELAELQKNDGGDSQKRKEMKEALGQVNEGLSKGDRSKFKEGMEGLAGQCKSQGNRKKLSDLLRKQCQSLSECKSECEGECKSLAQSAKKGGKKAGTAASGNEPGEKTVGFKTSPQMNIIGQDSGQGDIDVETVEGDAEQQQAVRQYREKLDSYEAMTESVLSSESIPLGHRQTIRRYFESIRPGTEAASADSAATESDSTPEPNDD